MSLESDTLSQQPKIRVVIRKRPLNKKQLAKNESDVVDVKGGNEIIVREQKAKVDLTKYVDEHTFKFDYAIDEGTNNAEMYNECVRPIVQCAFLGAKVTCFAYGQTGSGKTHTMNGDLDNHSPGMYYLGAEDIFGLRDQHYPHLSITVSFYEIYCGKLFDLLNNREQLLAREDAKQNVNIIGLTVKAINGIEEFMNAIAYGSSVRITSQNSTNADSSRSHAILQIELRQGKKTYGKISFIDLAGCERGADTLDQNKQTKIDGAEINKSLLALKECIRALDQGKNHTPFRGSKLTMVLKDSFTGFCKTLMIGNISPGSGSCENTLNTLRYADRVKQLKKGGSGSSNVELTKQDKLAKQLMLPRNLKNKQTIIKNESDDEDERTVQHQTINVYKDKISTKNLSTILPKSNSTIPLKAEHSLKAPEKKPRYIVPNQNNDPRLTPTPHAPARRGILNNYQPSGQGSLKSVNHYDDRVNREQKQQGMVRNKSVIGKDIRAINAEDGQNRLMLKNNHSFVAPKIGGTVDQNVCSQSERNSFTRMMKGKERYHNVQNKPEHRYSPNLKEINEHYGQTMLSDCDYREWDSIIDRFRRWQPSASTFVEMSERFEELVKYIMREELQVADMQSELMHRQQKQHKQLANLLSETQLESKNNEEMADHAQRLAKHLSTRISAYNKLKTKAEQYKYHLKEHQFCESLLMQAGEVLGNANHDHIECLWENHGQTGSYTSNLHM